VTNVDLDRGMILGGDDPVSSRAARTGTSNLSTSHNQQLRATPFQLEDEATIPLPGDVEVHRLTLLVLHGDGLGATAAATTEHRSIESIRHLKGTSLCTCYIENWEAKEVSMIPI
jgi:hypothetical protein